MTRAERAAEKLRKEHEKAEVLERTQKEARARQQEETRKAEAVLREETRKATYKRRYHVGALADEAGLFVWNNSEIAAVFAVLAGMKDITNPAAVLEGLLGENGVGMSGSGEFLHQKLYIAPTNISPVLSGGHDEKVS